MPESREGVVSSAYQRQYEDPISLMAGEKVRITKRDLWNDEFVWIWCINDAGKEGWVPDSFVEVDGNKGIALQAYNAIELTVAESQKLHILEDVNGWYWVRDATGNVGWVPVDHVRVLE
jgi:hypothetical protein